MRLFDIRTVGAIAAIAAGVAAAGPARAVTYGVSFSAGGSTVGTGSISADLGTVPLATLTDASFTIDRLSFTLADQIGTSTVTFGSGAFSDLEFLGVDAGGDGLTVSGLEFSLAEASGTTITGTISAIPEPLTVALMGAAIVGLASVRRRVV